MGHVQLAIVMPAYNEEACIESVTRGWLELVKYYNGVVIVVNDGSKDQTGLILDKLAQETPNLRVFHKPNGGHGPALMYAYNEALRLQCEWVFQTDSDDQFHQEDFSKLWALRDASICILGNRLERFDALHRLVLTRLVRIVNFSLFGHWISDANIPFRLMRKEFLSAACPLIPPGYFAPNIPLSVIAASLQVDLMNVPIRHKPRQTGKVSILGWGLVRACLKSLMGLLQFRKTLGPKLAALQVESPQPRNRGAA